MDQLFSRDGTPLKPNTRQGGRPLLVRDRTCWRCGGQGGAEAWRHTGWTCYRCGGTGIDPTRDRIKLYTQDELDKLNARKAKADAKRAAARAEAARIEQERRDREREEIISANKDFIARIDAELAHGEIEVLRSVRERIVDQAKEPTDRQIEVVNQIIERNSAERVRRAAARHVGEIKERREFTLTLLYTRSVQTGQFPTIWSHWSLFTDENGCKIACTSAPWTLGLSRDPQDYESYTKGQTIRVKATVVKHEIDKKGEPITYINRPKEL